MFDNIINIGHNVGRERAEAIRNSIKMSDRQKRLDKFIYT